jgi:nucleoside phosphorylase
VFVAPIASGEKVLASTKSNVYKKLRRYFSDALAVEEEGYGFLKATSGHREIESLVVRGISDLLDNKNRKNENNRQRSAAENASAFAFEVLYKFYCNRFC